MLSAELRTVLRESGRYFVASALALAVDAGTYIGLVRVGGVHYLVAAPAGFMLGLLTVYLLSARWAFSARRYDDRRIEFALFSAIGASGLLLNQLVLYAGVDRMGFSPEAAKLLSAGVVFAFNFSARKVLLFTPLRSRA